ncbi:NADH:ubiquinone oxidoreductase subunit [Monoraphidium neglectum]|uniref:NADH:ubiquinone oxidoreductase subunit n=1 Tax=Monoraphidium neglectum TaxID=145388 RepID=A0A0D2MUZ2_9CHLO|nr:NADH:ubiquinone oxidoreductase subunit [Monoraphidium neglectum]KIZ04342.1 NADH:ubiquinone oxidoreductase subunit [Monoraphidium neglectum]|eukprot:XP_013903361.1 NADH:ubiquinone oxidoreductase subunit [Monoraphidium neglectum]
MVQFYVIDKSGARHTVRGLEGITLSATLREYGAFDESYFMPHPMEPASTDCHVYVGNDYIDKLTPLDSAQQKEQQRLVEDFVRQNARENSRMAHFIRLTPQLNGMTVALGPIEPWKTQ